MDDKIDWEKGDVEENEEHQLDPELWDKPIDKEEIEAVDNENTDGFFKIFFTLIKIIIFLAIDKETQDLTAKDDDSVSIDNKQVYYL